MDQILGLVASAAKGGYKTSEFWLSLVAVVLPMVAHAQPDGSTAGMIANVATAAVGAGAAAAYSFSRGKVKAAAIDVAKPYAAIGASMQVDPAAGTTAGQNATPGR
jgi:hypothetical protein